jgi:hypothetical protein
VAETNVLVNLVVLRLACRSSSAVKVWDEGRAVVQFAANTVVVVALVKSLLEDIGAVDVSGPAVDKVAVEPVARGVAVGEDPGGIRGVVEGEVLDVVDELVEEGDEVDGVSRRAVTTAVGSSGGVGHVRGVVRRVEVDAVPARREVDLHAHSGRAVVVEKVVPLGPVRVSRVIIVVVEADERDRLVGKAAGVVCPAVRVSSDHAETVREGRDVVRVVGPAGEVVGVDVVDGYHLERLVVGAVVVQLRGPVVGLVDRNGSGGAARRKGALVGHRVVKVGASDDRVNVLRHPAGGDDRVHPSGLEHAVREDEVGVGRHRRQGGQEREEGLELHRGGVDRVRLDCVEVVEGTKISRGGGAVVATGIRLR